MFYFEVESGGLSGGVESKDEATRLSDSDTKPACH